MPLSFQQLTQSNQGETVKATSIRNLFIVGGILVLLSLVIQLTQYRLPDTLDSFSYLEDLRYIIETIGIPAGLVCIAIGLIALYKRKKKQGAK
jgi:hypothetical protein